MEEKEREDKEERRLEALVNVGGAMKVTRSRQRHVSVSKSFCCHCSSSSLSRPCWFRNLDFADQSSDMAAAFASKFSRVKLVGRSLLDGLGNNLSASLTASNETVCSSFISQQQRTFIQMRTVLKVVDNSGAKKVMCIQSLKGKKGARLGDTIVASVKEAHPNGKVKKGKVVYGVVVRAAMQRGRCDGSEVKFDDNAVVLVDKQGQPIGTRVFGPVPHELRKKKHVKILTLAEHIA
ncbi:unnamed protein product [Citrullus colocynthis]|uniref:Uncharacterized protein n=1 Tax=Citrullus colocynthis TaxID=252529 RepID=A0ABP0YQA2_9ROSI